jgi:hypothetical protein
MYTKNELNVLQQALSQYRGPYDTEDFKFDRLTDYERKRQQDYIDLVLMHNAQIV